MQASRQDRRRHVRVRVRRLTLQFRRGGVLRILLFFRKADRQAPVVDCSDGGLMIVAAEAIKRGTPVTLRMHPSFFPVKLTLKGKVSHCRRRTRAGGETAYEVGVELGKPTRDYQLMVKRLREDPTLK